MKPSRFTFALVWNVFIVSLLAAVSFCFCAPDSPVVLKTGDSLPEMQAFSVEGLRVDFRPASDRILLVLFWDTHSWQAASTAAFAQELYRRFHAQGLDIVGVCRDTLEDEILGFSGELRIPWPQVMESEIGDSALAERLGIRRTPAAAVLDAQGKVLASGLGLKAIPSLLAEQFHVDPKELASLSVPMTAQDKRDWGPEQVTGEPDTPEAGDFATAWASSTPDGQEEWLQVIYDEPIRPSSVKIYENLNPGAVCKVSVFTPDQKEEIVWQGIDPTPADRKNGISEIPLRANFQISRLKIYLSSQDHPGWNEIDAVGLVDAAGVTHWPVDADSAGTYAQEILSETGGKSYVIPTQRTFADMKDLRQADRALAELKQAVKEESSDSTRSFRYHLKTFVEGSGVLVIHRNTARWYQSSREMEIGRAEGKYPTYLNGVEWFPQWADGADSGWSSIFAQVSPALPAQNVEIELKDPQVKDTNCASELNDKTVAYSGFIGQAPKGRIYILQRPSAENDYVLAVAFEDFVLGSTNLYECYINVRIDDRDRIAASSGTPSASILRR